jgi:hypothetical protein
MIVSKPTCSAWLTPVGQLGEGLAVVEIRGVNDVSGSAKVVGEGEAPGRQSLCMWKSRSSAMRVAA